ncbi:MULTISPECIES: hypothetical protein [Rhizobium]|uniref:hypothetical protein n=1 Tax=Rhizobium TaxID=379 RepID=UPI0003811A6A|nr:MULTISPECIES: hypothetical protein [Rhizobium]TBD89428.1 hypothetical protein ELH14_06990 [Rhizobium ruizarguesonis]TBZ72489.1 hypothetical protein E0H43_17360 [Rhizobium leguminosarum bv. viciae]UFW79619.1 hypothetical protein RlegSU303_06715 [Rhizobium leguminosarum bv. viciae]
MNPFNRMTVVAACEVVGDGNSHNDMEVLEAQWGISGRCNASSKSGRVAALARIAIDEDLEVMTENGRVPLSRAVVESALKVSERNRSEDSWTKLVSGLRFDGFEIIETETEVPPRIRGSFPRTKTVRTLARMLPEDVPELDFREAESEVVQLLERHGFTVAKGHLQLALSAFERGAWSSANGELRKLYESYLDEIAEKLGYQGKDDSKGKRDFLGTVQPPFLLEDYNEWNSNNQKPQYIQGLMSRMHPHGGHAGLSEEEDATFRLQITLVTARLLLRRFDKRTR